jgi:hypothetical protein
MLVASRGLAQETDQKSRLHPVHVKAGRFFLISGNCVFVERDTTFYLPGTVDYFQRKHSLKRTKNFYQNVQVKLYKTRVSKLIYEAFFRKQHNKTVSTSTSEIESGKSEIPYLEYSGKLIGDIEFKHLKPFGTNINDTTIQPTGFKKFFNRLYFPTGDGIIRSNLLLAPGSILEPSELADNERQIRRLNFIKDARILVIPKEDAPEVDLLVISKDVFPYDIDINFRGLSSSEFGISNINMFGTGHQFESTFIINDRSTGELGYEGKYTIPNIKGTFIQTEFDYANTFRKEGKEIRIFRDFITPDIRYAGAVEASHFTYREPFIVDLTNDSSVLVTYTTDFRELWAAKAVRSYANPPLKGIKERVRLVVAGSVSSLKFGQRPTVEKDTNFFFHNRTLFLTSLAFSERKYYKGVLITNFGRTEDIPIGNLAQITAGYEISEFEQRLYLSGKLSKGRFVGNIGYLKAEGEAGGFLKKNRFEQGVIKGQLDFFSQLYSLRFFRVRQFISANYTIGIRRNTGEFININDNNGLRGVNSLTLRGAQRLTINAETLIFTPLHLVGFRLAVFGFADLGIIGSNKENIINGRVYKVVGFGIRIKNDNLAFSTIQLRFGFYSGLPIDASTESVNFASRAGLSLDDFDIKKPAVLGFE